MYTQFFGLTEKPFSITPDPHFLFLSERHAEALAHLVYGVSESGGFIQLTGEVGTGKTTLTRKTVLLIDEAQNLDSDVLEQLRLLTNLETSKHKLLQIILVGQPELRALLARNDLRQLAQRVTGRYHLEPPRETIRNASNMVAAFAMSRL